VKTRNVFSVVKRQRGGLCLEGVSSFSLLCGVVLMDRLLDPGSIVGSSISCISYFHHGSIMAMICG
jgi:hypothetical protein